MLTIVTGSEATILRQKAKNVSLPLAKAIQELLPQMVETMRQAEGIGLAAPQVGVSLRICVTEIDGQVRFFINPKITTYSKKKIIFEEGCLSLPGKFFPIERSESITIHFLDEKGVAHKEKPRGLLAICLQHEQDHLDGVLIIDRFKHQKIKHVYAL